jgi:acyl-CoA reductase-like NAD-dependent aldehyde dehydrogenase
MNMTAEHIQQKMTLAREAQRIWRTFSVKQRLQFIKQLRIKVVEASNQWIEIFAEETNKTPTDTLSGDVFMIAGACKFYEKHAISMLRPQSKRTPLEFFGQTSYVTYDPLGVVLVIAPWNFPLQLSLIPLISALIAGNAVILKPSEYTPRINARIEQLLQSCGFPQHLVQLIHGDGAVGEMLIDARPDKVFFTGGGFVGQKVYERAARHMIPCDLELGGNDAMIVAADANLERAAKAAVWGAFMNSGQVCIGVERVYVQRTLYEPFVERIVQLTQELRQGTSAEHDVGGMSTQAGFEKVRSVVELAVQQGAKVLLGGYRNDVQAPYFPPTVLVDVNEQMHVVKEETFGPVLSIMPVDSEEEAVARINAGRYGLNSYIFSRDLTRARRLAEQLQTGNCYINDVITNIGNMYLPFGGVKASGLGRYHGAEGLYTFCNSKSVMVDKGRSNSKFNWFPYSAKRLSWFQKMLNWLYGR